MALDGAIVRVSVVDHGTGVSPAFRHRIFDRFAQADSSDTRSKGGIGLGLTIAKSLIEQMGGTIGYTTEAGLGATFFFDLPVEWSKNSATRIASDQSASHSLANSDVLRPACGTAPPGTRYVLDRRMSRLLINGDAGNYTRYLKHDDDD
jgi:hypothetical protein